MKTKITLRHCLATCKHRDPKFLCTWKNINIGRDGMCMGYHPRKLEIFTSPQPSESLPK